MSLIWEPAKETVDLTLLIIESDTERQEKRMNEFRDKQTIEQLDDLGIGFDKGHTAYARDYSSRRPAVSKRFVNGAMNALIISALIYGPIAIYLWCRR